MLSSFQHPRSSIFLSLEQVTLPLAYVHTPAPPPPTSNTTQPRTSMACSFDGPPWNKNARCLSKASFIRDEQKEGFTSALFPPLGPGLGPFFLPLRPLLSLLLLTSSLGSFSTAWWGCEVYAHCAHVSMLVYTVRLAPFTIGA